MLSSFYLREFYVSSVVVLVRLIAVVLVVAFVVVLAVVPDVPHPSVSCAFALGFPGLYRL